MNTIEGMIEDLERKDTYIGGCTTKGELIITLRKLQQQPRWIPVSEKLPEENGYYLVTIKWKGKYSGTVYIETDVVEYDKKIKKWICGDGKVIAWMPLPEPYKESDDND